MSSSEQAPEPTMDEILASIRKIISDDEPGDSPQPEAVETEQAPPAGDGLSEDLANALNDTQPGAEGAEDILDLTQIVDEQPPAPEPQMEAPQGDALQAALGDVGEAVAAPEPAPAPQVAQDEPAGEVNIEALLAEAGVQDIMGEAPSEPQAPAGEDLSAMLDQGSEQAAPPAEDASISEALSAMDQPSGEPVVEAVADAAMPESETVAAPQAEAPAPVEAALDTGAISPETTEEAAAEETASEDAAGFEVAADVTAEALLVPEPAAEPEAPAEEAAVVDEPEPMEDTAPAEEQAPDEVAAAAPADGSQKTLEDSVKELLRPMLREWLDGNMERIVKDEVASGGLKGSDG